MMTTGVSRGELRTGKSHAFLAAALVAVTALVRVPIELYRASADDFMSASRDLMLTLFAAGILLFALLAMVVVCLPARLRANAGPPLVAVAGYAWIRSGFFPGPSVSLDGLRLTADLSTGPAGLLVPLGGGALLAWLGTRQPRFVTMLLAVLLGGSLVQSLSAATAAWGGGNRSGPNAVASTLEWSRNGNVLILILDSVQSDVFADVLEAEPRLRDELDGFRYYRLASSHGPRTHLSLPTIHGGESYDPAQTLAQYHREAVYEGSVLNRLAEAGYRTSYAVSLGRCPRDVASCVSTLELARSRLEVTVREVTDLLEIGVYRIVPDGLRKKILGRGKDPVGKYNAMGDVERAQWSAAALARLASAATVTDSPPTAKMIHSMLTHSPMVLQADCSAGAPRDDREGALLQVRCAFTHVVALLERLRALEVYDASSIVLLADHGFRLESRFAAGSQDPKFRRIVGAFNPLVLVKPALARGPLTMSDAPIELADVAKSLCVEERCSPAEGLRSLDAVEPGRTRAAFWYTSKPGYRGAPQLPELQRYSIRGNLLGVEAWSREGAAYAPGTVLDFRRGGNARPYVGFGWGRRQPAQTWMIDPRATLFLKAAFERGRDYVLLLDATLSGASPETTGSVTVEVNEVELGELTPSDAIGQFKRYRIVVPGDVLSRSSQVTILFSAKKADAVPGRDLADTRLGVQTLELRPLS